MEVANGTWTMKPLHFFQHYIILNYFLMIATQAKLALSLCVTSVL